MKKRIISLLICAVLLTTVLCGCGGEGGKGGKSGKASGFEYLNKMPDVDLEGYNFVIAEACYYSSDDRPNMEAGASELSDAILARNKAIEKKFNCTISYEYYDPTSFYDEMYPIIMSGEKVADIMDVTLFTYGKLSVGEYLYDMATLPHVDFKQDHWLKLYDDTVALPTGERFGGSAAFANPSTHGFGLYFNKRLISELGLEDPYKLLEENKWDWEHFATLVNGAMKDSNSDATFDDNDIWSITGGLDGGITAFYLANGLNMFDIDDNGFVRYAMTDENVIPTLTKLKSMFSAPGAYYYGGGDSSLCTDMFINGQITFYINLTTRGQALREMKDDFGFVPIPMGPDVKQYYSAIDHNTPIVCVPSSIDNPEATGLILEALAATSYSELDVWQDEIAALYYRDDESAEVLGKYILPNLIYDPVFMYSRIDKSFEAQTITAIFKPIARDPNADAATIINSGKEAVQTLIDEVINSRR
ncbi:MAG: extracellular solute-binding protein [Clostridia bacterium]|nr:extracellular solute-binding protein [Clostridia bacterium]